MKNSTVNICANIRNMFINQHHDMILRGFFLLFALPVVIKSLQSNNTASFKASRFIYYIKSLFIYHVNFILTVGFSSDHGCTSEIGKRHNYSSSHTDSYTESENEIWSKDIITKKTHIF